jgi:hypothetical protein
MSQAVKDCLSGTVGGIAQVLAGQVSISEKIFVMVPKHLFFFVFF